MEKKNLNSIELVESKLLKNLPKYNVGESVRIAILIQEGNKERNQFYEGIIISIKGHGINKNLTVRRISQNIGIERIFFLHSPKLISIEKKKIAKVRRAKLYYLRNKVGEKSKIKEKDITFTKQSKKIE